MIRGVDCDDRGHPVLFPILEPMSQHESVHMDQSVAILVDGNNIEMSLHALTGSKKSMIDFDRLVPDLLQSRALSRLMYFREGISISQKLSDRLQRLFHGSVMACYKSADIPLTIRAIQIAPKVDTIIILSGDADYVELIRHLKSMGVRVEVAAIATATAQALRDECEFFFPIDESYCFGL